MIDRETVTTPAAEPACGLITDQGAGLALAIVEASELLRDLLVQQIAACLPEAQVIAAADVTELSGRVVEGATRYCILLAANGDGDALRTGIETAARTWPGARVAVVPEAPTPESAAAVMQAGGHGVIPKSYSRQSFTAALAVILSGEPFVPWTLQAAHPMSSARAVTLTERERLVLTYLGEGMSNREIAGWLDIREVTVKLHIRALFKKLGVNNRTRAVRQAIRMGVLD